MLKDLLKVILTAILAVGVPPQAPKVPTESATVTQAVSDDTHTVNIPVLTFTMEATPAPAPTADPTPEAPKPTPKIVPLAAKPTAAPTPKPLPPVESVAPQNNKLQNFVDLMIYYQPKLDPSTARAYAQAVVSSSERHGIDPLWIIAMMWQESNFENSSTSSYEAIGLMQILPSTAKALGYTPAQIRNPQTGIEVGVGYLASLKEQFGDIKKATTAYNQGSSRVSKGTARMWYYNDVNQHYNNMKGWITQHGKKS